MELLGDRNWWLPKWLDRLLPSIAVEGHPSTGIDDGEGREGDKVLVGQD
jgi:RND superfamily putative drug exporter